MHGHAALHLAQLASRFTAAVALKGAGGASSRIRAASSKMVATGSSRGSTRTVAATGAGGGGLEFVARGHQTAPPISSPVVPSSRRQ